MQAILSAMQEDTIVGREMAKASHELAQEMKRDSVAMRTVRTKCFMKTFFFLLTCGFFFKIAVVTMFFLPGATFAVSFNHELRLFIPKNAGRITKQC